MASILVLVIPTTVMATIFLAIPREILAAITKLMVAETGFMEMTTRLTETVTGTLATATKLAVTEIGI